jgi:hypothetical protein
VVDLGRLRLGMVAMVFMSSNYAFNLLKQTIITSLFSFALGSPDPKVGFVSPSLI